MRHKTVPTDPFKYTYKIWDVVDREYVYTSVSRWSVYCIYNAYYDKWVYREKYIWRSRRYYYDSAAPKTHLVRDYRAYQIHNHFGQDVTYDVLRHYSKPYRHRGRRNYDQKKPDVRYKKGNPNKIKRGYGYQRWWDEDGDGWISETAFITDGFYRDFNIMPERIINQAHMDEYGEEIVRAKRRPSNLPELYDDLPNSAWDHAKCWKKHSKRRHQWKPKD